MVNNKLSLLMLHISYGHLCHGESWIELNDTPYLVGRVIRVVDNNELSLLMLHIWLVGLFVSRKLSLPDIAGYIAMWKQDDWGKEEKLKWWREQ